MESGEVALAAIEFEHAATSDPKDPRPYNALGILRDQAGEHDAAQALYRKALEQDPMNTSARNNLGLSLALNGKRDEAIAVLAELAVDTEGSPDSERTVLRNLEAAYTARANPPQAMPEATPGADVQVPENAPATDPVDPVAREPLDVPLEEPGEKPQAAPAAATMSDEGPAAPADGAPTPLFMPPAASAGHPQQSGARPAATLPEASGANAGGPQDSVILAAAARLMQPPAWADFEPGALIDAEAPPQNGALDDVSTVPEESDPMEVEEVSQPGEYSLSMLMTDDGASVA